jgi:heavy metal sensor kinase
LTFWYSAVLLLGLCLFATAVWFALEHRLLSDLDSRLAQRITGLRTVLEIESALRDRSQLPVELAEFAREIPEGGLMQLVDGSGKVLLEGSPIVRDSSEYRTVTSTFQVSGETYHVRVAGSLNEISNTMSDLRKLLWLLAPAVLLVGCWGGYWISGWALAPVDEITRVAKSISLENLSKRLTVPSTGDELQRMSEAWNGVLERLDREVKRISRFTADASHELRSPVALIRTTAEVALRRDRTREEYQTSLRQIQSEAERMTELTESLLALARADTKAMEIALVPTDLNEIVRDVVDQTLPVAATKGISLQARPAPIPATAAVDASAMRRLLLVLVENALRHTNPGGAVVVSTAPAPEGIVLSVNDTGEGIRPEALPHVFERFFRVDTARSGGSGVGLGLSIAQSIAEAHGSEIAVESKFGEGARFALLLRR